MNRRLKIAVGALRPLAKGKQNNSVRLALISNIQKLLIEWISTKPRIGDEFIVEMVKDDSD